MSSPSTFGQWLKQRRKVLGLTQKELAQQAGCAEVTVRKVESGDLHPSAPLAVSLAKAAGAAEADLPGLLVLARASQEGLLPAARRSLPRRPNNLTAQLTQLFGRERDIAAVRKRLLSDGARLITLLGPPGVGKTRLAQAVAEDVLEHFEHGAFFVRLAPIGDPDQVASTIAQTLGLQMSGPNSPELQLRAFLEEKHLLLVLDNFEQVVKAAPLVDDLLRRCPWLHILVTSRQPLRLRGERQMPVLPLALPAALQGTGQLTAADALRYSAVALFAERAEAVQPDFAVDDGNAAAVAELCRRLDGLPLAIELVAARIKLLPPAALLARLHGPWLLSTDGLRDVSARQKTLRGAIGWSYDLLSPDEQTLFTYLSVFVGGFTVEAAELLCGDTLSPPLPLTFSPSQVLDGIASLLDKNLLQRDTCMYGGIRYVMLETVREYGLEQLTLSSLENELRMRHAWCLLQLIERAKHRGPRFGFFETTYVIDDEIDNMRSALAWAVEYDILVGLLLAEPMLHWYQQRGPFEEGRRLVNNLVALPTAARPTTARARALFQAGILMIYVDDYEHAQAYEEECLLISRSLSYRKGEADAFLGLGWINSWYWQNHDAAIEYLERAIVGYTRIDDCEGLSMSQWFLSRIKLSRGDFQGARELNEASLANAQQAGFQFNWPLNSLADVAFAQDDLGQARTFLEESLSIETQSGENRITMGTLLGLAVITIWQKDHDSAQTVLGRLLTLAEKQDKDDDTNRCLCLLLQATIEHETGSRVSAVRLLRGSLPGLTYNRDEWGIWGIRVADMAIAVNQHELAATLVGATEATDEKYHPLWPIHKNECIRLTNRILPHLSAEHFDAAWAEGRKRPFDDVIEEAVSILEEVLDVKMQAVST